MNQRRGTLNKTEALRIHARHQAHDRYRLELTDEELRHLVNVIRKGKAEFVSRKSIRVSCWKVSYRGCELVVLYDRSRRAIVTFLPADCWEVRQCSAAFKGHSRAQDGVAL